MSCFDNPWWGFMDDGSPPPKESLFEHGTCVTWSIEDFLQHNGVFVNSRGQTCHSDSYGTLVEFTALEKALKILDQQYQLTIEDWSPLLSAWEKNPNTQIPIKIVSSMIKHHYEPA